MRIPGLKTVRQTGRWLTSRVQGRALILGYHRVWAAADDPHDLCVSPAHFAAQMAILRREAHPLSLSELVSRWRAGRLPPRAVAVTFDDGYLDTLTTALPVLARESVPATVFVMTGCLGAAPWWDAGAPLVDAEQLRLLASSPLIEIGAHTVTHPRLHEQSPDEQRQEIVGSKQTLEGILGRPVHGFSYPHGVYNAATVQIVAQAGFSYACNSCNDVVRPHSDNKLLPRFWIPDVNGDQFAMWLRRWLTA